MNFRPGSNAGSKLTPGNVPLGTASRLRTGAVPGTGRPGTRGGAIATGMALLSQVQVSDRPVTQQGLGGLKTTANKGNQRMVQDKTYFLGVLRNKINDLTSEIGKMKAETMAVSNEQGSYVSYEKRAESLARELEALRGELGDYNTLVDKLNTDTNISDMQLEVNDMRTQNDREAVQLDALFEQKQQREIMMKHLEVELEQEKNLAESMISDMEEGMRKKYGKLKELNDSLLKKLDEEQQQIDALNIKKDQLEEELMVSPVKQEAVRLYEQLRMVEAKRDQMALELGSSLSPQQEKDKLLKQVKDDNVEIAAMERQTRELQEKLERMNEESQQLDVDLDMNQGERSQQYRELKQKEQTYEEFFRTFEETKSTEQNRMQQLEQSIVHHLEQISKNLTRTTGGLNLPTPAEFEQLKGDLSFKEKEKINSENTMSGLSVENKKLQDNLKNLEDLERKMKEELDGIRNKMADMNKEIETYSDIDQLKRDTEEKKRKLESDRTELQGRRDDVRGMVDKLNKNFEEVKSKLNENDMHTQLVNLERKWQHLEQGNFAMKDFISSRTQDADCIEISKRVTSLVAEYNKLLIHNLAGRK